MKIKERLSKLFKVPMYLALKAGKLAKAFKIFKLFKFGKLFFTFGTMALSILVYALHGGWAFATGLVLLLFCHEMGHVWAMHRQGMKISLPVFIPMLGAIIFAKDMGDRKQEAAIGFGGPLIGSLCSLVPLAIWWIIPSHPPIWMQISWLGLFINLFNMIPISPMDGGRITQVGGTWFKYLGASILLVITILIKEPSMLLIWLLVLSDMEFNYKARATIAVICFVSMTGLMICGVGHTKQIETMIDVVIGSLFTFVMVCSAAYKKPLQPVDQRPLASSKVCYQWIGAYVLLFLGMIGIMIFEFQYLPKPH